MPDYQINPWISFLRQYGPIPRNDNMYDESIQRAIRRKRVVPLRLETGHLQDLLSNFRAADPASVILTGTAGDGKTYLCRELWTALGGTVDTWEAEGKTRTLPLSSGARLVVIKDLSEFHGDDYEQLAVMAESVLSDHPSQVFLIAANDGQLVEAWNRSRRSESVERVSRSIEELLVSGQLSTEGVNLRLYNLSRSDTAELFQRSLEEIRSHPGWRACDGCRGQLAGSDNRCPIWENYERLRESLLVDRIRKLLELCDRNGFHLPMRQLLLLASNALLGHPDGKDGLLQCRDVPGVVQAKKSGHGSIYTNLFGGNLAASRRAHTEAIEVLGRLGIGEETNNRTDNLLVFGGEEPNLRPQFDRLIRVDQVYGGHDEFLRIQAEYLEGASEESTREFLDALPAQRRRLFFTIPDADASELRLWDLTVFQFAGEYLDQVVRPVERGEKAPRHIVSRLVQGMNRIFTGLLSTTDRELVLASSGSFSQSRISRIEEYSISVDPRKGERIAIEHNAPDVEFAVYLEAQRRIPLELNVLRYEFLSRVAEGALPSSFSRECYEDILSFKSKLLREWVEMRRSYGEEDVTAPDEMQLRLLELDARGKFVTRAVSVKL